LTGLAFLAAGFLEGTGFLTAFFATGLVVAMALLAFLAGTAFLEADLVVLAFTVSLLAAHGRTVVCVEAASWTSTL
jgi:hypothetical protein